MQYTYYGGQCDAPPLGLMSEIPSLRLVLYLIMHQGTFRLNSAGS